MHFSKEHTKSTKFKSLTIRNLRVLRNLRGDYSSSVNLEAPNYNSAKHYGSNMDFPINPPIGDRVRRKETLRFVHRHRPLRG